MDPLQDRYNENILRTKLFHKNETDELFLESFNDILKNSEQKLYESSNF